MSRVDGCQASHNNRGKPGPELARSLVPTQATAVTIDTHLTRALKKHPTEPFRPKCHRTSSALRQAGRQELTSHPDTSIHCEASFGPNIHETSLPDYSNGCIRCQQQTNRARNRQVRLINGSRGATAKSTARQRRQVRCVAVRQAFVPSIHYGGTNLTKYLLSSQSTSFPSFTFFLGSNHSHRPTPLRTISISHKCRLRRPFAAVGWALCLTWIPRPKGRSLGQYQVGAFQALVNFTLPSKAATATANMKASLVDGYGGETRPQLGRYRHPYLDAFRIVAFRRKPVGLKNARCMPWMVFHKRRKGPH
ncbi:hypothetical protein PspLS_08356 [Pyricularia sp. CBS 133598]|nr:hypothetical protein PspLS_08356 [Pyricularia sp. CBS 133598]